MQHSRTGLTVAAVLLLALLPLAVTLTGCGQQSVQDLRANYSAELNGWVKKATPAPAQDAATEEGEEGEQAGEEASADGGEAEATADAGEGDGEGAEAEMPEPVDVSTDVMLDIVVKHRGAGELPGVTLDVYLGDPESDAPPKGNWKVWVDTSDMPVAKQVTHTLEDVEVDEGLGFSVEVREHVPPEERGEYREFQQQGS